MMKVVPRPPTNSKQHNQLHQHQHQHHDHINNKEGSFIKATETIISDMSGCPVHKIASKTQ